MTHSLADTLEHRRIRSVAQDYRDRGYEVIVQPDETDLPAFLSGCEVDLYAQNSENHVIVEVKTRTSLAKSKDLLRLAELVQDRPGWRFELVVTNPKKDSPRDEETVHLFNEDEVEERFQQVEKLLEQNQFVLAMLLAWTATEAALRLIAQDNEIRRGIICSRSSSVHSSHHSKNFLLFSLLTLRRTGGGGRGEGGRLDKVEEASTGVYPRPLD